MDASIGTSSTNLTLSAAVVPLTTAAWFAYFTHKGWARQHAGFGLMALLGGFASAALALAGYALVRPLGLEPDWETMAHGHWTTALRMSLVIGFVEEVAKAAPVILLVAMRNGPLRPQHALLFAALAGVGFSAAESALLLWGGDTSWREGLARAAAAPVTHALFAAPWGLGLGALIVRRTYGPVVLGGAVSVWAHALYDLVLARREVPDAVSAGLVLCLWAWLILRTAPRFQPVPPRRPLPVPVFQPRPGELLRAHHVSSRRRPVRTLTLEF